MWLDSYSPAPTITHMKTAIAFIAIFALICFGSVCLSQTFDRASMSHYLCLVSGLLSLAAAAQWTWKLENKVNGESVDE
jgi:hypothetical protein